jgi:hypothetical protein
VSINPAGDKGILANSAILKEYIKKVMRSVFRDISDMERGSTEVGFEHDLEPMECGIFT